MTKKVKEKKPKNTVSRKRLVKCKHCGTIVPDSMSRRQHLKDVDHITQDDGSLISKASVRKHFVREGDLIEKESMDESIISSGDN